MKKKEQNKEKEEYVDVTYSYSEYHIARVPKSVVDKGDDAILEWICHNVETDAEEIISY